MIHASPNGLFTEETILGAILGSSCYIGRLNGIIPSLSMLQDLLGVPQYGTGTVWSCIGSRRCSTLVHCSAGMAVCVCACVCERFMMYSQTSAKGPYEEGHLSLKDTWFCPILIH